MIKKQMVRGFIIGLSYYLVWVTIDYVVVMITSSSPSRKAYGILSAWWAALYLCSYINIVIKDIWYLTIPGILYAAYLAHRGHDSDFSIVDNATWFFFLLTPFLMNLLFIAIKKGLTKKKRRLILIIVISTLQLVSALSSQSQESKQASVPPIQLKGLRSVSPSLCVSGLDISYSSAGRIEKRIDEIVNKRLRDAGLSLRGEQGAVLLIVVDTYRPKDEAFSDYLIIEVSTDLSEEAVLKRNRRLGNPHGYVTWETRWVDIVRRDDVEAFVLEEVRDQLDTFCSHWESVNTGNRRNKPHKQS